MNRDEGTLLQIADAARLIVNFSQDMDVSGFEQDALTRSAVLYQFAILGEAVKRLSDGFRESHHEIPWSEIAGMRDRLIHGYDVVNLERVLDAIWQDVPALLQYIEPLLPVDPA